MPWKELPVCEQRLVLVQRILQLKQPVAVVAREFSVSRKTAYKWIKRFEQESRDGAEVQRLEDRSRRPRRSPRRSDELIEQAVLSIHDRHNWGARKIHRVLSDQSQVVPSIRTTAAILKRHGRVGIQPQPPAPADQRFERPAPNHLWQLDHKGVVEVARRRCMPLTVIDDHSRYCLCFTPMSDMTLARTWERLWNLFGEMGLPEAILCDNAFSGTIGISWFDSQLVRLNIRPIHGRSYHPQTQGKIERLHGTIQRELIDFAARRDSLEHFIQDCESWRCTYNTLRPHESLGDLPPIARWKPSERKRPGTLPSISYTPGAILRKVSQVGDISYRQARIVVGRAIARQFVEIRPTEQDARVYYGWKAIRVIPNDQLSKPRTNKII
jgi:transposase InsO family protein